MQGVTRFYFDETGKVLAHRKDRDRAVAVLEQTWEDEPTRRTVRKILRDLKDGREFDVTNEHGAVGRFLAWKRRES